MKNYKRYIGSNPYKGFLPFIGEYDMDSSMEFFYIPLNKILIAKEHVSWLAFEKNLNEIDHRNHTAVVRFYIDYPTLDLGLPEYMKEKVDLIEYDEFGGGIEPNYHNDYLINELVEFIKIFGEKYDGDERIAFVQCGLIGHWGEWHTYPHDEYMPTKKQLEKIIKAYAKYFKKTKVLTRYPKYKFLKKYHIGFHDDSFCYSTLPRKKGHFGYELQKNHLEKCYLHSPIGGELRPEEQENLILGKSTTENYDACVLCTRCSWLINQTAFLGIGDATYINKLSSALGYDFYIDDIEIKKKNIRFNLYNLGKAPIYYNFDCNVIITYNHKQTIIKLDYDIRKLLPYKRHQLQVRILNWEEIKMITFSMKRGKQVIHLSNKCKKNDEVILYQKGR